MIIISLNVTYSRHDKVEKVLIHYIMVCKSTIYKYSFIDRCEAL